MKPFLMSVLKCPKCDFSKKLRLSVSQASTVPVGTSTDFIVARKKYFVDKDCENLKKLVAAFDAASGDFYRMPEDRICAEDNAEELNRFVLGNVIDEGCVTCDGCAEVYPIKERILKLMKDESTA